MGSLPGRGRAQAKDLRWIVGSAEEPLGEVRAGEGLGGRDDTANHHLAVTKQVGWDPTLACWCFKSDYLKEAPFTVGEVKPSIVLLDDIWLSALRGIKIVLPLPFGPVITHLGLYP